MSDLTAARKALEEYDALKCGAPGTTERPDCVLGPVMELWSCVRPVGHDGDCSNVCAVRNARDIGHLRAALAEVDHLEKRINAIVPASEIANMYGCRDDEAPDEWAARIVRERDRLDKVLRCERGAFTPDGWTLRLRDHVAYVRNGSQRPGRVCDVVQHVKRGALVWHGWDRTVDLEGEVTETFGEWEAGTALECIEAADAARSAP